MNDCSVWHIELSEATHKHVLLDEGMRFAMPRVTSNCLGRLLVTWKALRTCETFSSTSFALSIASFGVPETPETVNP
eukprot:664909-Amphidinium_carterae.1